MKIEELKKMSSLRKLCLLIKLIVTILIVVVVIFQKEIKPPFIILPALLFLIFFSFWFDKYVFQKEHKK